MTGEHSSKQYDLDLEAIRSKVLLMGGLVENQLREAMDCFPQRRPGAGAARDRRSTKPSTGWK